MDANQVLVFLQAAGQIVPIASGTVTSVVAAVAAIREALAAHGIEVDNAALDRIIADAELRANRAKQDAEGGPAPESAA